MWGLNDAKAGDPATWPGAQDQKVTTLVQDDVLLNCYTDAFMAATVGSAESKTAMAEILKSHRENVWHIVAVENSYYPTFWTTRIKNVPEGTKEDVFGLVVNMTMEQWYVAS